MIRLLEPWIIGRQIDILQKVLEQRRLEESECAYLPTEPTGLILPEPQRIQYASANDLSGAYDAFGQMDFDALRGCAELAGVPIIEGRHPGGDFPQQNLIGAYICAGLQKANLTGVNAVDAVFRYTDLRDANLSDGDFSGAVFYGVDFRDADLTGANFENARFINCRMGPLQDKAMDATGANLNIHYMHQCTWDGPIDLRGTTISGMFSHSILHQLDMRGADVNNLIFVATLADTLHFSETATNIEIAHSSRVHATHPNPCEIYVDETSDHQESLIYIPHVSERGLIIPNLLDSESIGCPWRGDLHNHPDVPWSPHFQDPRFASLWNKLGFSL